jgi:hypothetical protein
MNMGTEPSEDQRPIRHPEASPGGMSSVIKLLVGIGCISGATALYIHFSIGWEGVTALWGEDKAKGGVFAFALLGIFLAVCVEYAASDDFRLQQLGLQFSLITMGAYIPTFSLGMVNGVTVLWALLSIGAALLCAFIAKGVRKDEQSGKHSRLRLLGQVMSFGIGVVIFGAYVQLLLGKVG